MNQSIVRGTIVACAVLAYGASASAQTVTVLGGGLKGGAYAMAVGFSKLLKEKAGMNAQPQTSGGMVAQARLLDKGSARFAFGDGVDADTAADVGGELLDDEDAVRKPGRIQKGDQQSRELNAR